MRRRSFLNLAGVCRRLFDDRRTGGFGGYQGIWRQTDPQRYFGGSDSRKDGCAIGY